VIGARFRVDGPGTLTASGQHESRVGRAILQFFAGSDDPERTAVYEHLLRPLADERSFETELLQLALDALLAAGETPTLAELGLSGPQKRSHVSRQVGPVNPEAAPVGSEAIADAANRARRAADDYRHPYEDAVRSALARAGREAAAGFLAHVTDPLTAAGGDEEPPANSRWTAPSIDEVLPAEALRESLHGATDPIRRKAVEAWLGAFGRDILGIHFKLSSPFFGAVLEGSAQHITGIAEETRREVIGLLARATQDGLSIPTTAELIRSAMTSSAGTRATTIARTELARISNGAAVAGVQIVSGATGQRFIKRWLTAPGAEHPRHENYDGLDGQTVALDATFQVGDADLSYPGDPNGDPGETIGCRCVVVFEEAS
jgi:hypothetical protein